MISHKYFHLIRFHVFLFGFIFIKLFLWRLQIISYSNEVELFIRWYLISLNQAIAIVSIQTANSLLVGFSFFASIIIRISFFGNKFTFKIIKFTSRVVSFKPFLPWFRILILNRYCFPRVQFFRFRSFKVALVLLYFKVLNRWCFNVWMATSCFWSSWITLLVWFLMILLIVAWFV